MGRIDSKYFDHTILKPDASKSDIERICKEAIEYKFASVCVNQCRAKLVSEILKGSGVKTCVVVGFPLGAVTSDVKAYETKRAIEDGAEEIDMVINVGELLDGNIEYVQNDIRIVKNVCKNVTLKVIIETCLLSDELKIAACKAAVAAGADFVKTSTGFSKAGATAKDVTLMKQTVNGKAKVKAAGGIRDYETAIQMIDAGADRLGTSATVSII